MVVEQLMKLFQTSLKQREKKRNEMVSAISEKFTECPEKITTLILLLLQEAFKRRKSLGPKELRLRHVLISRILCSLLHKSSSPELKETIIRPFEDYLRQCSRSLDSLFRAGVIDFIIELHSYIIAEIEEISESLKEIVRLLLKDKEKLIRQAAVKLANALNMKNEIIEIVQNDPTPAVRCDALGCLVSNDEFLAREALSECLSDEKPAVRVKVIQFYRKTLIRPSTQALRMIFRMADSDPERAVRSQSRFLIKELIESNSVTEICDIIDLSYSGGLKPEFEQPILTLFAEYLNNENEAFHIAELLLPRLLSEKEKLDHSSLFILRICISALKSHREILSRLIETFNLDQHFPKLLDFFLRNQEEHSQDYFFKLQCAALIIYMDLEESSCNTIIKEYFRICELMPLKRLQTCQRNDEINVQLVKEFRENEFGRYCLAKTEEDVIATIVAIVREIYRDAESFYLGRLKEELIDSVINGVIMEEIVDNEFKAPLKLKLEKIDQKLKQNEENLFIYNHSGEKTAEDPNFDQMKSKLELKKIKRLKQISEGSYRGLLIISWVLKHAEFTQNINAEYSNFAKNLIIPELDSKNLLVSVLAHKSLGYSCLLSNEQAELNYKKFFKTSNLSPEVLVLIGTAFVVDLLLSKRVSSVTANQECLEYLLVGLKDTHENVRKVAFEGLCKLLLKNSLTPRVHFLTKVLSVYLDLSTSPEIMTIAKAFIDNYVRISEEYTSELANAYLMHLWVYRKKKSIKIAKAEEKTIEIAAVFDPQVEKTYQKTENLQLLIFVFCCNFFESNDKLAAKIISSLNTEGLRGDPERFVINKLNVLRNRFKSKASILGKLLNRLKDAKETVEDIGFRDLELRVKDIEAMAAVFAKDEGLEIENDDRV